MPPPPKGWHMPGRGFGPRRSSTGAKIPDSLKRSMTQRILKFAEANFADKYTRIDVRFRGTYCYIDAYQEPDLPPDYPGPGSTETRGECLERLRDTPTRLCRLGYAGRADSWTMALYTYSGQKYEPCVFEDGSPIGTPEDAFLIAARLYLQ